MFTPGGDEGVFRHGDEAQPGHPPPVWGAERFKTPEIVRFNEEFGIEIVPEADRRRSVIPRSWGRGSG
jgi:hypothetical protein